MRWKTIEIYETQTDTNRENRPAVAKGVEEEGGKEGLGIRNQNKKKGIALCCGYSPLTSFCPQ